MVFRIEECELDLIKYKTDVYLNKCIKDLNGATEKCNAEIAEEYRVCEVDAAEANARSAEANVKFAKVNTELIKARGKASKCKRELRKWPRKCPV